VRGENTMDDGLRRRNKSGGGLPGAPKRERSSSESWRDQWVVGNDGRLSWDPEVEQRWTEARERALRLGLGPDAPDNKRATVVVSVYSRDLVVYGVIIALTTIIGTIASALVFDCDLQGLVYPYISETARDMPQTGAFGFGMTISSMFMIFCAVLQHGKVKRDLRHTTRGGAKRNFTALVVGIIAPPFLGLLAVYDTKRALMTHRFCVVAFFLLTMIYMVLVLNIYELLAGSKGLASSIIRGGNAVAMTANLTAGVSSSSSSSSSSNIRSRSSINSNDGDNHVGGGGGGFGGGGGSSSCVKADSDGEGALDRARRSKFCDRRQQHSRQRRCSTGPTLKQLQSVRFSVKAKRLISGFFFFVTVLYLPVGVYFCSDATTDVYLPVDVYTHAGRAVCQHLAVISIILFYGTFYYDFGELNLNLVINQE
jgi:hypothetical protein